MQLVNIRRVAAPGTWTKPTLMRYPAGAPTGVALHEYMLHTKTVKKKKNGIITQHPKLLCKRYWNQIEMFQT